MNSTPLTIWCNAKFPLEAQALLARGAGKHRLILAQSLEKSNLVGSGPDEQARAADVALGQPHPDDLIASASLKWIHLTSAGYTRYDRAGIRHALVKRGAMLTNSSMVYADPCAQHVLAFMFARGRKLHEAHAEQIARHGWPYQALRGRCEVLTGQSALIVGYGSIGQRLIELLAPFRMTITAARRKPRGDEPVQTIPASQIDQHLGSADHVIDVLPAGTDSHKFFSAERFARMKTSSVFYNIGRGDTVDQSALAAALGENRVAAAYLDVTTPEPLPPDDPLWSAPNCYITPHLAGGQQQEMQRLVEHFLANLSRFAQGQPLLDRIV
jgi:phosphoglycerate dehydrogenase-like enzyme